MIRSTPRTSRHSRPTQSSRRFVRRGWSLIEMLVTISVMAALTGIAVQTMAAMLRAERTGTEHVARLANTARLARQFRADVHVAKSIATNTAALDKPLLLIQAADERQIQYQVDPAGLLRTESRPNQPPRREIWRLKQTQFQCLTSAGPPQQLALVMNTVAADFSATPASQPAAQKVLRIEAIVGRDLR